VNKLPMIAELRCARIRIYTKAYGTSGFAQADSCKHATTSGFVFHVTCHSRKPPCEKLK
jgi:hypothetical protein